MAKVLAHTVGQAMSKEHLAVVEPGCSLPDAAELMLEKRVGGRCQLAVPGVVQWVCLQWVLLHTRAGVLEG